MLTATKILTIRKEFSTLHKSVLMRNTMDKLVMEHPLQYLSTKNICPSEMHRYVAVMIRKKQTTMSNVEKDLLMLQESEKEQ